MYREVRMTDVKEVLRLWLARTGKKRIGAQPEIDLNWAGSGGASRRDRGNLSPLRTGHGRPGTMRKRRRPSMR